MGHTSADVANNGRRAEAFLGVGTVLDVRVTDNNTIELLLDGQDEGIGRVQFQPKFFGKFRGQLEKLRDGLLGNRVIAGYVKSSYLGNDIYGETKTEVLHVLSGPLDGITFERSKEHND